MDMVTKGGKLSQCIRISNIHIGHFKYLIILFINYILIKLGKDMNKDNRRLVVSCVFLKGEVVDHVWICHILKASCDRTKLSGCG